MRSRRKHQRAPCVSSCEHGRVQGRSLKQQLGPHSGQDIVVSMAASGHSASDDGAAADSTVVTVAAANAESDQPEPAGRRRPRVVRPRIDIDDQIREASRVSELLKKMGHAAKTLKKSQTKAKQRLVKKAARLSPQDLERIAVLKRVFGDADDSGIDETSSSSSSLPCTSPPSEQGITAMHETLKKMMSGVAGADDVVAGLGARVSQQDKQSLALAGQDPSSNEVTVGGQPPRAKAPKRLQSLRRLPSAVPDALSPDVANSQESQSRDD